MSVDDDFLATVQAMHAAALDAERWPEALRSLARLFSAMGASYEVFRKRPLTLLDIRTGGLPSGAETAYIEHFARINPRADYAFRHLSQTILCDYPIIDERAMDRDPYYVKYLGALDLRYFMSGQIVNDADIQGIVSIQRTRRQGHVDRRDIGRMRRLLPHVRQAYDVSARLRGAQQQRRSLEHALDWLADGVLLVRDDGRAMYVNAAARDIVGADDGVRLINGALEFAAGAARTGFEAAMGAVRRLCSGDVNTGSAADFTAPRPSGAPAYFVMVRPLFDGEGASRQAEAMVFIRDPLRRRSTLLSTLHDVLGLTEAEADLAQALQAGVPLGAYARQRAVSLNTIYTHLRRIREKTGCRRMSELIHRLNDLRAPLRDS